MVAWAPPAPAQDSFLVVIVVGVASPVKEVSAADLKAIYLGEKKHWPDGTPIVPIDQAESDPIRELFSTRIMGKSVAALRSYWVQQIFAGKGTPPKALGSDRNVKEYLALHKGAIGYIRSEALDPSVRIIPVDGKSAVR
jgi:ABC-type phosphate transport system substrate-binding protein